MNYEAILKSGAHLQKVKLQSTNESSAHAEIKELLNTGAFDELASFGDIEFFVTEAFKEVYTEISLHPDNEFTLHEKGWVQTCYKLITQSGDINPTHAVQLTSEEADDRRKLFTTLTEVYVKLTNERLIEHNEGLIDLDRADALDELIKCIGSIEPSYIEMI